MPSTIPDFVLQLTSNSVGGGCGKDLALEPIEAALNGIDARLTDEQQRELLRVHLNSILVGCVAALETLYNKVELAEDEEKGTKKNMSENEEKRLQTLKRCCRTISRLLRSPEFARHLTVETLTRWVLAIAPLSNKQQHLMEVLESKTLLLNALDRSLLFRALLGACKTTLVSLPSRSGFGFLVKQLSKLVKRLEMQLRLFFDHQADPMADKSSEFAELAIAPIIKEVDELLVATEKKRFPTRYAEVVAALVEELESLLNLLAVYAEIRGVSIRNYFSLVPKGTESVSFRYVTEQKKSLLNMEENKENEGPEGESLVFIEKPEVEDFEKVDADDEADDEADEVDGGHNSDVAIDKDWIVVDDDVKIPENLGPADLSELELDV